MEGTPTLIIRHGKIVEPSLSRERITHDELITMLRRQGIRHLSDVDSGIFESDGRLTVITVEQSNLRKAQSSVFIDDGSEN